MPRARLATLVIALAPAAAGAVDGAVDGLDRLVAELDHEALATRERASAEIVSRADPGTLALVENQLLRRDLSPEQRVRLRDIAQRLFNATERGGMGVSFDGNPNTSPVQIGATIRGFPAADVLRARDRIVSIDGEPLLSTVHMRWIILSKGPGETLDLEVIRAGENNRDQKIRVAVPLGRYSDLDNAAPLDPGDLRAAFDVRLARRGINADPARGSAPLGRDIDPIAWLDAEGFWPDFDNDQTLFPKADYTRRTGIDGTFLIDVGGQPRAIDDTDALRAADVNHRERPSNRRLAGFDGRSPWEQAVALVRVGARRVIEIEQRIHEGIGRNGRPGSLDGLRRERDQIIDGLQDAARHVETLNADTGG